MTKHKVLSILLYSAATLGVAAFALHVTSQHDRVEETDNSASAETNQTAEDTKSKSETSLTEKVIDHATSAYLDAANKLEDAIIRANDTVNDKNEDNSVLQVKATEVSDSSAASGRDRAHETKTTQTALSSTDTNQQGAQQVVKETPIEHQVASEDKKQNTEAPIVEEKDKPDVRPTLPEAKVPEKPLEEKGQPEVRPVLPEAVITETGTPEIQPTLPESKVQETPAVPETPIAPETPIVTEKGIPEIQPALPEAVITETGTPEIQPALPEAIVTETGTPEAHPALPEAVITETGTPEVQPALPEASIPETPKVTEAPVITEKGQPEVVQIKPEYHFHTETREEVTTLKIRPRQIGSLKMNKGETKIIEKGKDGSITKVYEEVIGERNEVLSSNLKNETRIEPIEEVSRYGTKLAANDPSETGLYRISEHTHNIDVVKFNQDTELNGHEIKALGQDEINRRSAGDESNTLLTADKSDLRHLTIYPAPLSDESIDKFNSGEYIDHKRVGKEVLKLVNQERHKLGLNELSWSDDLYELAKVRATEIGENGNIRFWTADGKRMAHVRDTTGKSWLTVSRGTKFSGHWLGENLADYTTSSNVYKAFSEKLIAEQLYTQWYGSEPHYKNMISKDYTQFAFDLNYSKFWRLNGTSVNYLSQGIHGVQLFAE